MYNEKAATTIKKSYTTPVMLNIAIASRQPIMTVSNPQITTNSDKSASGSELDAKSTSSSSSNVWDDDWSK